MSLVLIFPPSLGQLQAEARADILREWLSRRFKCDVFVRVAASYEALKDAIDDGTVDMAWAPPSVCAAVELRVPAIYKAIRGGRSTYCAALVARPNTVTDVADVRGKRAAWVDPLSVGGYLLPVAYLRRAGIDPERDLAGQQFVGAYGAALRAVLDETADLAAIYCPEPTEVAVHKRLQELIGKAADDLSVVAYTPSTPADGLVITQSLAKKSIALEDLRPIFDGTDGHTFFLSLLEADRLVRAKAGDYAGLRG